MHSVPNDVRVLWQLFYRADNGDGSIESRGLVVVP